jgi:hypothetical protein
MSVVHSALSHCPDVEEMDVWLEVGRCTGPEVDRWDFPLKESGEGVKYPSLKRLKLDGYSFGGPWMKGERGTYRP